MLYTFCLLLICLNSIAQAGGVAQIEERFQNPPATAKPWVFWYWMHAAVSKAGITADLEAMKRVGIGGAYLMPIKDTSSAISFKPVVRQLTPEWWAMVKFAMQEAKRLQLQLGMHVSDGFALAGGPWITPELSMQKLVWTKNYLVGGTPAKITLDQPVANEDYYKDVAVFAYPANASYAFSDTRLVPTVTNSLGIKSQFLSFRNENNKEAFRSDSSCWIQYKYPQAFTCRSVTIHVGGNNYQAQRLQVLASSDGINFKEVTRLEPPRHGWQDTDEDVTSSIPATTARYFRFVYEKSGTEPGAEDLDAAKWKPSLKLMGIYLSDEPVINQFESKNGSIWRVSQNTTVAQVPPADAVPLEKIINLTGRMDAAGNLNWTAPPGNWVLVRIGHTSTGHTNATGGAGIGLECDKFSPAAVKLQFDNWFAKAFSQTDPSLAKEVLKIFHVDSWECGSQNWSSNFKDEFQKRRGYDLMPYLLSMTGVPVESAATSEKVLHDVRQTIADLVNDVFYVTLKQLSAEKGCSFSAEAIAPTMVSDGMLHYKNVDLPMGEFWLNSPTHDKLNDMLDAVSGAHIYGKNIVQAEAFTSVRMNWGEHPGNLKTLGDRNFALGINKMVLHVFTHNPWMDKMPGMTLDGVGLYYQRDQTWFEQSKSWIDYLARCQALLQMGKPVVDVAVFTGEEIPLRAVLPNRLLSSLPGIFGKEKVAAEQRRLQNAGQPLRQIPDGVNHSANMADPEDWIDPLNGYAFDSFNPDALMMMRVENGRVVLPGGASYAVLVLPGKHLLQPNSSLVSVAVLQKVKSLVNDGARIIMSTEWQAGIGLQDKDKAVMSEMNQLLRQRNRKGKIFYTPFAAASFKQLGLEKDVDIINNDHSIAWTHRSLVDGDIYFISNQKSQAQTTIISFRTGGKVAEVLNPVDGSWSVPEFTHHAKGQRTKVELDLAANQSLFIVFRKVRIKKSNNQNRSSLKKSPIPFAGKWRLRFAEVRGADTSFYLDQFKSWTESTSPSIKHYSGTAIYSNTFLIRNREQAKATLIELDSLYNLATVSVNGIDCGTIWTPPYQLDITKALQEGENRIEITVANTWHNRLIGDNLLPPDKRVTFTTAPFRLKDKPLLPAGIVGELKLVSCR